MDGSVYSLERGIYLRRENLLIHLDFAVLLLDVFLPLFWSNRVCVPRRDILYTKQSGGYVNYTLNLHI